jgi:uncharacterized protein involved in high-affinity Fe2+ transport
MRSGGVRVRALGVRAALAVVAVALIAGCASADKTATTDPSSPASTSTSGMGSMNMSTAPVSGAKTTVGTLKPVPTQKLLTADWQDMKISAMAMTPVPFVIYNGTTERMVKPTKHTSFHLMVYLNDARTGVPIPYAGVWATIHKAGKLVWDGSLWPMISEYMGPHYGDDVSLPGKGTYQLSLLVSPPKSARHVEYMNVWLHPHQVADSFTWNGS